MDNSKSIIIAAVAILAIGGGVIWAMSRNDNDKDNKKTNTSQTDSATQDSNTATPKDIVGLAIDTSDLSTLVSAVKAAGLVETLQSEGPYTVLAPTNAAFSALPSGTLDTLLKPENVDQLKSILTYHVISGKVMSSDLTDGQEVTTVQGAILTVKIMDGKVYFVDTQGGEAEVVQADVGASNGVVHVIDAVLLAS